MSTSRAVMAVQDTCEKLTTSSPRGPMMCTAVHDLFFSLILRRSPALCENSIGQQTRGRLLHLDGRFPSLASGCHFLGRLLYVKFRAGCEPDTLPQMPPTSAFTCDLSPAFSCSLFRARTQNRVGTAVQVTRCFLLSAPPKYT